ncbi:MAG: ABC transporter permease subunit [Lentisphaeria bacterium]|nr:ABC transporter permease subunit [Lentisphaerota bacterium]
MLGFKLNPVTAKRVARFRSLRRASWSLVALSILFGLSLISEVLCNDKPLIVWHNSRVYFPFLFFYPENEFTGSGNSTRTDYRQLAADESFRDRGGWMLWPLLRSGPYERVRMEELVPWLRCRVALSAKPKVGRIVVTDGTLAIEDANGLELFVGEGTNWSGKSFGDYWVVPESLRDNVEKRFRNEPSDGVEVYCPGVGGHDGVMVAMLSYEPRRRAPKKVNLTLRDPGGAASGFRKHWMFSCDAELPLRDKAGFLELPEGVRVRVLANVSTVFSGEGNVSVEEIDIGGRIHELSYEKEQVRYPFRPVPGHWFGLDEAGRDVLARILYGLRTSLSFGLILACSSMLFGTLFGSLQGYLGGIVDITGQRLIEIWSALPFLYIVILLGSVYGPSFWLLLVCYAMFNWIGMSYYMRAELLRLRRQPFVESARCLGLPGWKIVLKHILPNALVPIVTFFPFSLVGAVGALAALDYLGFGLPAPTASLGQLLQQAQSQRWAWWLILYPSLALFIVMLLGVFVGEGVREAFDPKRQSRLK